MLFPPKTTHAPQSLHLHSPSWEGSFAGDPHPQQHTDEGWQSRHMPCSREGVNEHWNTT